MIDAAELGSRRFLILSHKTPVDGDFSLNDLPGSGGRVDVISRFVTSSLLTSNAIRRDASASVYFSSPGGGHRWVVVSGRSVRYLNPDERSTSALIRNALKSGLERLRGESSPGIFYGSSGLNEFLGMLASGCTCYILDEGGKKDRGLKDPGLFIMGDTVGIGEEELSVMSDLAPSRVSVSSATLQADQCCVIVNWMLDNSEG